MKRVVVVAVMVCCCAPVSALASESDGPVGFLEMGVAYSRGTVESDVESVTNNGYGLSVLRARFPFISNFSGAFTEGTGWKLTDFFEGGVQMGLYRPENKRTTYSGTQQQMSEQASGSAFWSAGYLGLGLQVVAPDWAIRGGWLASYDRTRTSDDDRDVTAGTADMLSHVGFVEGELTAGDGNRLALAVGNHWYVRGTYAARFWSHSALQFSVTHLSRTFEGSGADARSVIVTAGWALMIDEI